MDLQTKTATFQSGLSDAAKSARGAFSQIKEGSGDMGRAVSGNMMEARHGVILLGEEFGIHLPRGVTTFLASIGPVGAAMEAAFPFLAIAVGATILIEHLMAMHAAGVKLTEDQGKFGTAANNAFNQLDAKLIQAQIRSDELKNDHLGALKLQLELIDKTSMDELVHSFEEVAKTADVVMKGLAGHWYTFGIGSEGAKAALDAFQDKYNALLSTHKDADADQASNLLSGTLKTAQEVLAAQETIAANRKSGDGPTDESHAAEQTLALHKASLTVTGAEIAAQQQLVEALNRQGAAEQEIAAIKKQDGANAKTAAHKTMSAQASGGERAAAEAQTRIAQQGLAAARSVAEAQLTIKRASVAERLAVDLDFLNREYAINEAGNAAQIGALDRMAADYPNALKALHEKALELTATHNAQMIEAQSKASVEQAAKDLTAVEQSEREKIEATQKGSDARLAAINAAIRAEETAGLEDTNYYRDLLNQRVQFTEAATEDQAKLIQEAGKESADNAEKTAALTEAAEKNANALADSSRRTSAEKRAAQETQAANTAFGVKLRGMENEAAALDKSGADYSNKLKQIQDKETQLIQAHENEITALKDKAEEERNARIMAAESRMTDSLASGLSKSIMGHENWSRMVVSLGDQAVSGMIENSIKIMLQQDKERLGDARKAATSAFTTGEKIGGPAGPILGPVFAAAAFAGVMAFQAGGIVPGVGTGDIVPAMLTPGEGVVPKGVMAGLSDLAKAGGMGGGGHTTVVHVRPTYHVNTVDGDGMQDALEKHTGLLTKHFEGALRRMNK